MTRPSPPPPPPPPPPHPPPATTAARRPPAGLRPRAPPAAAPPRGEAGPPRRERVRRPLRRTPGEEDQGAIAREVLPREVRVEAAVFDGVTGVVPGARSGVEHERVGEGDVEEQEAPGLRLAGGDKERDGQSDRERELPSDCPTVRPSDCSHRGAPIGRDSPTNRWKRR